MKLRAIALFFMIVWDASLHWVEILDKVSWHFLYPMFPLFGYISYDLFWTTYWTIAATIMFTLLGGGTTIKNTTITHTHIHEARAIPKFENVLP